MLQKYFLRKALRKALVNLSTSDNTHFEYFGKVYNGTKDLLVDLSMSQDEITHRVGLNTALMADYENLKIGKAKLQLEIQTLEATKQSLEKDLYSPIETQNQNG